MLFLAGETELTPPTDSTYESDANQPSDFDIALDILADRDDTPDAFVTTDVRELDVGNVLPVRSRRSAVLGV